MLSDSLRTINCWPSFLAIGVRQLVGCNTHDMAVLVMPFFDFPVAQTSYIPENVIQTSGSAKQWAGVRSQWMKEDIVNTFRE